MLLLCALFLCGGLAGIPVGYRIAFRRMGQAQAKFQCAMKRQIQDMENSLKVQTDAIHQKVSEHEGQIKFLYGITDNLSG